MGMDKEEDRRSMDMGQEGQDYWLRQFHRRGIFIEMEFLNFIFIKNLFLLFFKQKKLNKKKALIIKK